MENVKIDENSFIYPNVTIRENCEIGKNVIIHSGTVIGSDGFGYNPDENGVYHKIPQIGNVVIEGKSLVLPTGERVNLATGNVTIKLGKTVLVTGEELALATNALDVIVWNPIPPGVSQIWIPIDPDNP